ncbi:MAG: GNAT family N-acetyltransferase [Anaerolineae bacterium]|nr:GNAT family N-acetyltransferase [Anaerolineae bacterium]
MLNLDVVYTTFPVLESERLRLRQQRTEDAPDLFAVFGDPEVVRHTDMRPIPDVATARRLIDGANHQYAERRVVRWAVALRHTDALIGACACLGFDERRASTEIGYDLARAYWNQGYMTEALRAVLAWCFETVGVNRVQAMTLPWNVASMRVLHKLGFREEGILREYVYFKDAFQDLRMFALLKRDYDLL